VVFEEDSSEDLKAVIGKEGDNMNKDRLDWIMSGLNRYALTKYEDHFLKAALEDFDKKHALTEQQEERLERLYKEKSQSNPNKKLNYFSFKESSPKKTSPRRPRPKV
jgi:hypothetical protein